jgi:N6-adenosine-specific RNA methylase IME4
VTCDRHYRTILADPPWRFNDRGSRATPTYSLQGLRDIEELGKLISGVAADDSFLFLWAPSAFVLDGQAQRVAEAWGFAPKQIITWVKTTKDGRPALGMGHYTRNATEQLLLCRRGRAKVLDRSVPSVFHAQRTRHSAKPDESYQLIERLSPPRYLELFARRRYSDRWDVHGNEAPE